MANSNPIDSRVYKVRFPDGSVQEYVAISLAESIYLQVDAEGVWHLLMDEIINHHHDSSAICIVEKWIQGQTNQSCHPTTKGWKLQAHWKFVTLL
jgi:hypothetical protein